jgi:hypothetical protein
VFAQTQAGGLIASTPGGFLLRNPILTLLLFCLFGLLTPISAQSHSAASGIFVVNHWKTPSASPSSAEADVQDKAQAQQPAPTSPTASGGTVAKSPQTPKDPKEKKPSSPGGEPFGAAGESVDENTEGDGDFRPIHDRWRVGFPDDPRYVRGNIFNPYRQNRLKGDYPIIGQHTFLNLTVESESYFSMRRIPVPQDVSSTRPGSFEFFGRGRQEFFNQNFYFSFDIFHGETSFKPVDWRLHVTPVVNINYLRARENGIVNIDPREQTTRLDGFVGFEEMSIEVRLGDTSKLIPFLRGKGSAKGRAPAFDSTSVRVGVQHFNSDFRGFIFNDSNLGVRIFGNISIAWKRTPTAGSIASTLAKWIFVTRKSGWRISIGRTLSSKVTRCSSVCITTPISPVLNTTPTVFSCVRQKLAMFRHTTFAPDILAWQVTDILAFTTSITHFIRSSGAIRVTRLPDATRASTRRWPPLN